MQKDQSAPVDAADIIRLPSPGRPFLDNLIGELQRLRGTAMVMTRNKADADDLIQTTALRAINAYSQFTLGTNMRAWLYRIMRNGFIDMVRISGRSATRLDEISEEFLQQQGSQEETLEMRDVLRAMDKLSPTSREALFLFSVNALSYEEIAGLQSCALGTVKSRIARARRDIQMLLGCEPQSAMPRDGATAVAGLGAQTITP